MGKIWAVTDVNASYLTYNYCLMKKKHTGLAVFTGSRSPCTRSLHYAKHSANHAIVFRNPHLIPFAFSVVEATGGLTVDVGRV